MVCMYLPEPARTKSQCLQCWTNSWNLKKNKQWLVHGGTRVGCVLFLRIHFCMLFAVCERPLHCTLVMLQCPSSLRIFCNVSSVKTIFIIFLKVEWVELLWPNGLMNKHNYITKRLEKLLRDIIIRRVISESSFRLKSNYFFSPFFYPHLTLVQNNRPHLYFSGFTIMLERKTGPTDFLLRGN